jgi:hypothetical protein
MGHNRWKVRLARTRLGDGILGQEEWYFPLAHGASPATHTGFTTVLGGWKCISGRGDIPFPLPKKVVKICWKMQVSKSAGLVGKTFVHFMGALCAPYATPNDHPGPKSRKSSDDLINSWTLIIDFLYIPPLWVSYWESLSPVTWVASEVGPIRRLAQRNHGYWPTYIHIHPYTYRIYAGFQFKFPGTCIECVSVCFGIVGFWCVEMAWFWSESALAHGPGPMGLGLLTTQLHPEILSQSLVVSCQPRSLCIEPNPYGLASHHK